MLTYVEAYAQLEALYAQIPAVPCQGHCLEACGPLGMAAIEFHRLRRATPRRLVGKTLACPLLKQGRCTVYAVRPTICRLWGATETMPCPWGCRPERVLTQAESAGLLHEVDAVSQHLFPGQESRTMHTQELIAQRQEQGAEAVAQAVKEMMEW
jgi:hypothetical protein